MNKRTLQVPDFSNIQAKQSVNKQQNLTQNPQIRDAAVAQFTKVINDSKIPPKFFVHMGKLAEQAIRTPKKYSEFVNFMVQHKLETAEDLKKPDYQMLGMLSVMGKIAENMPDNQQPQQIMTQPAVPDQGI